ncbi:MAG: leucyl/phenylalanyl-tRNA--protein transferase [Desulfobulbaceae bacterium]|nr:leucyl/phenylalanyl-tRNA--protein transferase [Desulfobulbaceae bacterium]
MPVFRLPDDLLFPSPELAEPDGLLAIGGDLSPERIIMAYASGIFPWYSEGEPLLWWSPAPRLVLFPKDFHLPRRLKRTINQNKFRITADTAFEKVISACAQTATRKDKGTWITTEMQQAYIRLHYLGFAHSIECWYNDELAGGLYGICLDNVFFGESMFTKVTDGSKVALATLIKSAKDLGIKLIDCQMTTDHLLSFGAKEISRDLFLEKLDEYVTACAPQKKWRLLNR